MADAARKEKLAAAKKKLKKFQKSGKPASNSPVPQNGHIQDGDTNGKGDAISKDGSENGRSLTPVNDAGSADSSVYSTPASSDFRTSKRLTESTEQLHQFSRQLTGLIEESTTYLGNDETDSNRNIDELEKRNRELAKLLNQHNAMNEQLNKQVQELRSQNQRLSQGMDSDKRTFDDKLKREMGALKEQLQVHIQTIGILVAEKTELQSAVNQHQKLSEQRLEEIDDLSGRLKASRRRVADLERSFTTASSSGQKHEKESKEQKKEIDRVKMDLYKLTKSSEEQQQQMSELQGKLQKKVAECSKLEDQLIEVKGKLEMTDLHVQQLQNNGEQIDQGEQIQDLLAEKAELLDKLRLSEESVSQLSVERSEAAGQYEAYIEQLQQHSQHLSTQIGTLVEERDQYATAAHTLQTQAQAMQQQGESSHAAAAEVEQARQELQDQLQSITGELQEVRNQLHAQVTDNAQLSRLVEEKESRLLELDMAMSQMSDQQVDRDSLLETMQGDKTALSRAMAQNKELKNQLTELQSGFVKMSNDNMEMMTALSTAEHSVNDLTAKLATQEEHMKTLTEQVSTQRASSEEDGSVVEALQKELSATQDTIIALQSQNQPSQSSPAPEPAEAEEHNDEEMRQLQHERDQLLEQLREEQHQRHEATDQLHKLQHELAIQSPATLNGDIINKAQFEALQHAMMQLEGKYTKAMRDKADLVDQREQLEHIILQLQGETETIGEYVSLYQTQRNMLKNRSAEKDEYIWRLAREREELSDKLGQLQAAVVQLLYERNQLHSYSSKPEVPKQLQQEDASQNSAAPQLNGDFGKLSNSNLEDWPDYTSDDEDSETSEVEAIIATTSPPGASTNTTTTSSNTASPTHSTPHKTHPLPPQHSPPSDGGGDDGGDHTAQRIMHLLTEIGHSNLVDRSLLEEDRRTCLNCSHCRGKVQHL